MNKLAYTKILLLAIATAISFNACNKTEDYSDLVYKNYLSL